MKVKFWGVNGSIASPCDSGNIRFKLKAVLEKVNLEDLSSPQSIDNFIAALPHSLTGTFKGNTSCVQVRTASGRDLIFDSGTGVRKLAVDLLKTPLGKGEGEVSFFFSHLHWDHIQGFPFFIPAYIPGNKIHIYARVEDLQKKFSFQQTHPYFPMLFEQLEAEIQFHELGEGESVDLGEGLDVNNLALHHPQVSHSYSVTEQGKKVVYMTDSEFPLGDFEIMKKVAGFCKGADILIFDCQFTFQDAISKEDWGHSSVFTGIDIASAAEVKHLFLFHHEPAYDDSKIEALIGEAHKYRDTVGNKNLKLTGSYDGLEVEI